MLLSVVARIVLSDVLADGVGPSLALYHCCYHCFQPWPVLAMQEVLSLPSLVGSLSALAISLSHHGTAIQYGVMIRTIIPSPSILVSVFYISGGRGKAYK